MLRLLAASLICSATGAALAAPSTNLHYTARLRGIPLLDIDLCLQLEAKSYAVSIKARTVGLAELLVHGRAEGSVVGAIDALDIEPRAYTEHGRLSGDEHVVTIEYPAGNPVLTRMTPPQPKDRLPVPAADLPGAIDGLSAIARESLVASRTGRCDGVALVYDAFQLRRATTRTGGMDVLKPNPRSVYAGPALRCDTTSVMLAGFLKGTPISSQSRPRYSHVWLAAVDPAGPDVPVRISFDADILGDIIVDLDHVSEDPAAACAGA